MANLTVKNIPDELYEQLKRRAAENRRSLNSEAIVCLEQAVAEHRARYSRPTPDEIRAFRESLNVPPLDPTSIDEAIDEGRP
ncbi:MAG TPA: Arc family DNA-binding protein [Longimicrobiaceae bacterium]|nr:Arc family DNA-binding protein [Longimicrobiaceae bacterium]